MPESSFNWVSLAEVASSVDGQICSVPDPWPLFTWISKRYWPLFCNDFVVFEGNSARAF